jgi:hypothetical protein
MIKVKTFASPLKVFHVKEQLENLDTMVNQFIPTKSKTRRTLSLVGPCFFETTSTIN